MPLHRSLAALALLALPIPLAPLVAQRATPDSGGASPIATIVGTVYDSVAQRPLAGAVVQLVPVERRGSAFSATSDADGLFRIAGVPRERYLIGFLHPATDSLGLDAAPRVVDVRDSVAHVALALPSAQTIRAQLCRSSDTKDSTGLVLGFVRDADSGMPVEGSTVVVMWGELVVDKQGVRQERRQLPGKTSPEGWFALCGLPTDAALAARAELGGRATGYIELEIPPRGLLHQDFALPTESAAHVVADTGAQRTGTEPARRGTAQLTGTVRGPNGKPLAGAQVIVWGSASRALTRDDGSFTLSALPAGTQTLEARFVGYLPKRVTVMLASGSTTTATVTLAERVNTLDAVTVYGQQSRRTRDLNGFLQRSKTGMGRYITAEQIERRDPLQFTDLLFTVPGVRVMQSGPFSRTVVMREGCSPSVYLDGVKLINADDIDFIVNARDITGVEIYNTATIPPQFNDMTGCGSIVIWTGFRAKK